MALVVLAAAAGWPAGTASAHASLIDTEPTADTVVASAPSTVVLRFDEGVTLDLGGGARVLGPDGERVDVGPTRLGADGTSFVVDVTDGGIGTYTVAWSTVSDDSHPVSGSFVFHVQERTGGVDITDASRPALRVATWFARWLVVSGMVVLGGLALLRILVRRHVDLGVRQGALVALAAGLALMVGAALRLVLQVADATGRSAFGAIGLVGEAVSSTRTGQLDAIRLVAALAAVGAALSWRHLVSAATAFIAAFVVALANAATGHAWTADRRWLAVAADVVHQSAAAAWVGGLVAVLLAARLEPDHVEWVTRRFSTVALLAVAAVAGTGVIASWQQLHGFDTLFTSVYGRLIVVKVGVVALMVGLGWLNREYLMGVVSHRRHLLTSMRTEAVLGACALGLTAALVGAVPGRDAIASEPFTTTVDDGAGTVAIIVDPAQVGDNVLTLSFFDRAGVARGVDVAEVTVAVNDVFPRRIELQPLGAGNFTAPAFSLPTAGTWVFTITSVSSAVPATVVIEVPIP